MLDVTKFVEGLHDYIGRALAPVAQRLKALEDRAPVPGPAGADGAPGLNGKDGAPGERGEAGPAGTKGDRGDDGAQGPAGAVGPIGPAGEKGEPGPAGRDGADGAPGAQGEKGDRGDPGERGADGINGKDGAPGEQGPPGVNGRDGADGINGKDGVPGANGRDGADGKSITVDDVRPMLEGEFAKWALEFERRAADVMQKAIDRLPVPKDGRDGLDGFGFDDMTAEQKDEGRTLVLKFAREGRERVFELRTAVVIDRGVYRAGEYLAGDAVTYGGSLWIAQRDTQEAPGSGSKDWRLAVKRGRDGKDAA